MRERNLAFEDVLFALQAGDLLDDGPHPNVEKYPHQRMLIVKIGDYACLVPYVETQDEIFLKQLFQAVRQLENICEVQNDWFQT